MNKEEYQQTQEQIVLLANLVRQMPLKEFIEDADRAAAIGPILDPTLWRAGSKNLGTIMDLARSLREFQSKVTHILGEAQVLRPRETDKLRYGKVPRGQG